MRLYCGRNPKGSWLRRAGDAQGVRQVWYGAHVPCSLAGARMGKLLAWGCIQAGSYRRIAPTSCARQVITTWGVAC